MENNKDQQILHDNLLQRNLIFICMSKVNQFGSLYTQIILMHVNI